MLSSGIRHSGVVMADLVSRKHLLSVTSQDGRYSRSVGTVGGVPHVNAFLQISEAAKI